MRYLLTLIIFGFTLAEGAINPVEFETDEQITRYQQLIAELRCLVCQNQNLADSNAELALDLKNIVQQQILEGQTDDEILAFMTQRYGDFVLYRPPVKNKTLLLWLGPLIFLIVGVLITFIFLRKSKTRKINLSKEERQHAKEILENKNS